MEVTGPVFRMPNGKTLSENALLDRCENDNIGATPHGFRTSFRSWAKAEYGARFEAIELCLAHSVGTSVTQAYDREDLPRGTARDNAKMGRLPRPIAVLRNVT